MRTAQMTGFELPQSLPQSSSRSPASSSGQYVRAVQTVHADEPEQAEARAQQRITQSVHITRPAFQLYNAWKDLARGQAAQTELKRAVAAGFVASDVIKAPCLGDVSCALLVDHMPGLFLAWQSLPHAGVVQQGEVWFHKTSTDRTSEVCVILSFETSGTGNHGMARTLAHARAQIAQDLERFRELMER